MNKKNITIDTDFFDDGIEIKLKAYHKDQILTESGKNSQSMVEHYRRASYDNSIPNSRYEYVPDNQYSTAYEAYDMPPESINKLQAANAFQNIISRAMANLFVRCWEQMKSLLPKYSYLVEQVQLNQPKKINQQVLEDYNNVFNNHSSEGDENLDNQNMNVFSKNNENLVNRKNQIIERQNKGLTLDSLSKQRLNRSKSLKKQVIKIKTQQNQKRQREVQSRKSYRQKFLQYKHRSKSRDLGIQKSLTYTKLSSQLPYDKSQNMTSFNQYSTNNLAPPGNYMRNTHSASNMTQHKNHILRNMNDILIGRQDIYQGQKYNYYINHRDSMKNMYMNYQTQSYDNNPSAYFSKINYNPSTEFIISQNQIQRQEMIRTQLIQQIVDKLNYSKLRLQQIQKPKQQKQQVFKRIDKLQKMILQLKEQEKNQNYIQKEQHHQVIHHKIEDRLSSVSNQSQNLQIYKRFIDQIASLRSEIKEIKNIKDYSSQKPVVKIDNSSNQIISEQQKLLSSYQYEFQKLISEKEKPTVVTQKSPIINETSNKTLFDQLIQNGKNSQNKVSWNNGWDTNASFKVQNKQSTQLNQQTTKKSRRIKHLNNDQGFQNYRYTKSQVLQNIGLKSQVQQQQRLWREQQAKLQQQRQKRDEDVKIMVQNVRRQRNQQMSSSNIDKSKMTKQKYDQQWQKYQKTRIDFQQNSNPFCVLFPC